MTNSCQPLDVFKEMEFDVVLIHGSDINGKIIQYCVHMSIMKIVRLQG